MNFYAIYAEVSDRVGKRMVSGYWPNYLLALTGMAVKKENEEAS